jgi:hypothetical protein
VPALESTLQDTVSQPSRDVDCSYDEFTDTSCCEEVCSLLQDEGFGCPERTRYLAKRRISSLGLRRFLTMAFSTPSISLANDLLEEDLIYTDR